jgi:acetamidase/formamidase
MSAHKYLLEVVVMKGLKRIKSTAWAKSAKVLSGIGLGISATLILNGCGEPAVFALQPLAKEPTLITFEDTGEEAMYIPSTPDTIKWGRLPNATDEPLLTVASGTVVVFDTLSHEGILEDQGRDPTEYFASHSIDKKYVLEDAIEIAGSSINHNFYEDGPHIVTGPIGIEGAMPGDVLKVEILKLEPRVPYGVISNRHYKGALPGEFPETPKPTEPIHSHDPETLGNVSIFTPTEINEDIDQWFGVLHNKFGKRVTFPAIPFMGIMGVAPNSNEPVHSVPPYFHGGNIDIKDLGVGATLYLPVFVPAGLFYTGDPHMAQGDGEVALTALEQSIRATFRLTLIRNNIAGTPAGSGTLVQPFGETEEFWITMGFDRDLDEAMKKTVRESIRFLEEKLGMDRAVALAYLSAATDFNISQVVDGNKGIHALIRKNDFVTIIEDEE